MIRKRAKRLAGAVLAAGAITAMPFQAFAQRSPEFAYSAEKWATLRDNKLEFDEEGLKKKTTLGESGIEFDNISTLKSLFTGYGSFASQIEQKASAISSAAARTKGVDQTYNKSGAYSDTLSKLFGSTVDEKVGDKFKDKDTVKDKNKDKEKDKSSDKTS